MFIDVISDIINNNFITEEVAYVIMRLRRNYDKVNRLQVSLLRKTPWTDYAINMFSDVFKYV